MKILLLNQHSQSLQRLKDLSCALEELTVLTSKEGNFHPSDPKRIDILVGGGNPSDDPGLSDLLLNWRTHPHTYLIPCWVLSDNEAFRKRCLWPRLSIDSFNADLESGPFCDWLAAAAEWQQNRMHLNDSSTLRAHSPLELITSLALRKATGRLSLFSDEGLEGYLFLQDGCLTDANLKHLRGTEAFFDFFCWSSGSYHWEPKSAAQTRSSSEPLHGLIDEGLRLLRDANLLFRFLPDLQQRIERTESESALDDGAAPFFAAQKEIYHFIDGRVTAAEIIDASPVSRPRTMSCLARWFSMEDLKTTSDHQSPPAHRLLIVDDSALIRKALRDIFSRDPRFETVGAAQDGIEALRLIEQLKPDVVTLDMQMPRMDGLTALKHIMIRDPKPVVVLSAFTKQASRLTYESFKYGAVDVFTKPSKGNISQMEKEAGEIRDRVAQACCVRMEAAQYIRSNNGDRTRHQKLPQTRAMLGQMEFPESHRALAVILCGTGGFPSLLKLFLSISKTDQLPPILACMASPKKVVEALVPNLQKDCRVKIEELQLGMPLKPNVSYFFSSEDWGRLIGNGTKHMVERGTESPKQQGPFDHLLISAAESLGNRVVAMFLSGSGNDGLEGMQRVQQKGGLTFTLSPEACLKPELPRSILNCGYAKEVRTAADLASLLEGLSDRR